MAQLQMISRQEVASASSLHQHPFKAWTAGRTSRHCSQAYQLLIILCYTFYYEGNDCDSLHGLWKTEEKNSCETGVKIIINAYDLPA